MAVTVESLNTKVNTNYQIVFCLCQCIDFYNKNHGEELFDQLHPKTIKAVHKTYGYPFQNFASVYFDKTLNGPGYSYNFDINMVDVKATTKSQNSQSSNLKSWCKKQGLLSFSSGNEIALSEIGESILNRRITVEEATFLVISKFGIYRDNTYLGNFLTIIASLLKKQSTFTEDDVKLEIETELSVNATEFDQDMRLDISLNALCFCGILEDKKNKTYELLLEASDIMKDIAANHDKFQDIGKDNFDELGKCSGGICDLITQNNIITYKKLFPNLCRLKFQHNNDDHLNEIIYGCPGSGKTHYCQHKILNNYSSADKFFITFHQAYSYEEFIEGIKPKINKNGSNNNLTYTIDHGIFYKACDRACKVAGFKSIEHCLKTPKDKRAEMFDTAVDNSNYVVICIDEINRANIAKVFGDLISLIEPSKRLGSNDELVSILPYSKKEFGVPKNLKIVGTMNSSDRSIQLLDSALRRRFFFIEFQPDYTVNFKHPDALQILKNINANLRGVLNKDCQIGQAYLMDAKDYKEIFEAILYKIIPLLEEYFYNDIDKIRFVLNELDDTKSVFYIPDPDAENAYSDFSNNSNNLFDDKKFYKLDESLKVSSINNYKDKLINLI